MHTPKAPLKGELARSAWEVAAGSDEKRKPFGEFVRPKGSPLGLKGPIPPIRGKWPVGPKGVGTLAQRA